MAITTTFDAPLENDPDNVFDTKAFDTMSKLNPWADEANALAVEVNGYTAAAAESETNASASESAAQQFAANAQSAANFEGPWSTLTGAKLAGISVTHLTTVDGNDRSWRLKVDVADITLSEPGVSSDWFEITVYPPLEGVDDRIVYTSEVLRNFSSPDTFVRDIALSGSNLVTLGSTADEVFVHSGITASIASQFSVSGTTLSIAIDGSGNLISYDASSGDINVHVGLSSSVSASFSLGYTASAIAVYEGDLWTADSTPNIKRHTGVTATVAETIPLDASVFTGISSLYLKDGCIYISNSSFNDDYIVKMVGLTASIDYAIHSSDQQVVAINAIAVGDALVYADTSTDLTYVSTKATEISSGRLRSLGGLNTGHISLGTSSVISTPDATSFDKTITGNTTFVFTNPGAGSYGFILEITNGAAFAVSWPSNVEWSKGTIPTLQVAGKDKLVFITHDNGATWSGSLSQEALA